MKKNSNLIFLAALIILAIPSIFALFHSGFFQSDDGEWMIIRFSAFHEVLRDGQFPVRFLGRLNYGYGYPVANFLYPGFMYLAEPIHLLGIGFVNTVKIIFGLSMLVSLAFCFFWLEKLFKRIPAVIGSLFYLYTPYHLFDFYKRGSVGEVLALATLPFILWQIERKSFFWSTLGIGFLILSHNTLAILFLPLIIAYLGLNVLISPNKQQLIYQYTSILALGIGLSAFFWIPAVFELKYTVFSKISVSEWNRYFADISLIGLSTIFIFLTTLIFFLLRKIHILKHRLTVLLFLIGVFSLFLSSGLSAPLWRILPVSFIQFPFRFLSITILCASFLAACIISVLSNRLKIVAGVIILLLVLISSKPFITPSQVFDKGDNFYSTNEATTTVQDEYMPKWVKQKPQEHFKNKVETISGQGSIKNVFYNSKKVQFDIDVNTNSKVMVNTIYYPGWNVLVDGGKSNINYNNERGVMEVDLSTGFHRVEFKFGETPLRLFADIISLISLGALVLFSLKSKVLKSV